MSFPLVVAVAVVVASVITTALVVVFTHRRDPEPRRAPAVKPAAPRRPAGWGCACGMDAQALSTARHIAAMWAADERGHDIGIRAGMHHIVEKRST